MNRRKFGPYTAIEGKLGLGDARSAYVTGPLPTGRIAPLSSFWHFEEAVRWAKNAMDEDAGKHDALMVDKWEEEERTG